ncbi:PRC-barrel domain-containing protein [Nanoarchaeota archaeon]
MESHIRSKKEAFKGTITSDDVLGKDVIDSEGEFIGIVEGLHLHPEKTEVVGIAVDKGFLRRGFALGKDHIKRVTRHAVMLNTSLVFKYKGMTVFDVEGKRLGKVIGMELKDSENKVKNILMKRGLKKVTIPSNLIKSADNNIFLKIRRENLENL